MNKWLFFSLILLTSFIILYPKFPLINIPGTYVAIRIEDLLIALMLLIWSFSNIRNLTILLSSTIVQAFLLFWFIGLVSIVSAIFITHSVQPHIGLLHFLRRVEMMSLFLVAATTLRSTQQLIFFSKAMLAVLILVIIYGFGQIYLGFDVISTTNREFSKGLILKLSPEARVNSTFAGHYDLAVYLSIVIIFLGTLFFQYQKIYSKFLVFISGLFSFVLLGMTAARVSFLATLVGLGFSLWLIRKRLLIVGLILASLLVIVAIPGLRHRLVATVTVNLLGGGGPKYNPPPQKINVFTPDTTVSWASKAAAIKENNNNQKDSTLSADIAPGEPINTEELGVYRSFNIRTNVEWPRALRGFTKNPILGTGYSSLTIATDNDYLRSLGEVGLLGTLSFGLIIYIFIKKILRSFKKLENMEKKYIISILSVLVVYAITATFIDVLEASKIAAFLWILLGLSWSIANDYKGLD